MAHDGTDEKKGRDTLAPLFERDSGGDVLRRVPVAGELYSRRNTSDREMRVIKRVPCRGQPRPGVSRGRRGFSIDISVDNLALPWAGPYSARPHTGEDRDTSTGLGHSDSRSGPLRRLPMDERGLVNADQGRVDSRPDFFSDTDPNRRR